MIDPVGPSGPQLTLLERFLQSSFNRGEISAAPQIASTK